MEVNKAWLWNGATIRSTGVPYDQQWNWHHGSVIGGCGYQPYLELHCLSNDPTLKSQPWKVLFEGCIFEGGLEEPHHLWVELVLDGWLVTWTRSFQVVQAKGWRHPMDKPKSTDSSADVSCWKNSTLWWHWFWMVLLFWLFQAVDWTLQKQLTGFREFGVEIKPELLRTRPFYQFLPLGPADGFFIALARPFAPSHLLGCWKRVDPGSSACLQLRRDLSREKPFIICLRILLFLSLARHIFHCGDKTDDLNDMTYIYIYYIYIYTYVDTFKYLF